MQPIAMKCPDCAARLAADASAETVRCEYCGTVSFIRKRTRILQIPDASKQAPPQMPVATQMVSRGWLWTMIASGVVITGVAAAAVGLQQRARSPQPATSAESAESIEQPVADAEPPPPPTVRWWAKRPILLDVNGDGRADIVGHCVTEDEDDYVICSVDGHSGARLWTSEAIAAKTEIHKPGPTLSVAGSVLVSATERNIRGYSMDGSRLWDATAGEKITSICGGGADGSVRVELADKTAVDVALSDGKITPATKAPCVPLESDSTYSGTASRHLYEWRTVGDRDKRLGKAHPGMFSELSVHRPSTNTTIAVGTKNPGTRLPMVASYRLSGRSGKTVLWASVVPGGDAFEAYERSPKASDVEITDDTVFVSYAEKKDWHKFRMTAFAVDSGERRFEIELPGTGIVWGIAATAERAYVSRMHTLRSYDARTGDLLWTYPAAKK